MPTSMAWSRARSTTTSSSRRDDFELQHRCGRCGTPYGSGSFQVVVLPELESFDRLECATAPRRSAYVAGSRHLDLANLERLTAELFATRAALEKERRAYVDLQQAHQRLSDEIAAWRGAAASGGGT
jgi:hypothetical protein